MSLHKKLEQFTGWQFKITKVENNILSDKLYEIYDYKTKKKFYFCYDGCKTMKYNLQVLKAEIIENFNFCEILNCKREIIKLMRHDEYVKCKEFCIYAPYCSKISIDDVNIKA